MGELTPAMKQFMQIKSKYRDCVVFFRMGDFYETFYEDAVVTSKALDIVLTRRGMRKTGQSIPLAGIPYHALDSYLSKMIKKGHKVAIVEQLEDPKLAKGVVKRDVVRIVTPGTVIEGNILGNANNFIASMNASKGTFGISFVDISTGDFFTTEVESFDELVSELQKYSPTEMLLPLSLETDSLKKDIEALGIYITHVSDVNYHEENASDVLKRQFKVASLEGYGMKEKPIAVSAAGALLLYLLDTQKTELGHLNTIRYYSNSNYLEMDSTTIKNLELVENIRDISRKGSVLGIIDYTETPMGSRLLKRSLLKPLLDKTKINERLLAVEELLENHFILQEIKELLNKISDVGRLISRINYGNSNPRDLVSLHGSLVIVPEIKKLLDELETSLLLRLSEMDELKDTAALIDDAIIDDPPVNMNEGNFIREGFSEELDRYRKISRDAKKIIRSIEEKERDATGIRSLKIRFNRVFGYYIDITKPNLHLVPENYVKKQTLVNSERFITEELKKLEEDILNAEEKIVALEQSLFSEVIEKIKKKTKEIQHISENISYIDMLCSFATVSSKNSYVKPTITEDYSLKLRACRHPVVEQLTDFVSNDTIMLYENRVMIITGPNMAGKSVYMRQVAINIIMAQLGCFVPCDSATISIIDRLFCRTGAIDDISRGQSTFMVEMSETAQILNGATKNSFIILDEIGRGTSTYDGVSIAWSVAEYIARHIHAKTLFATHYHVLNDMQNKVEGVKNYNIAVQESEDSIIFLRKILEGGTDKSYGIHVAKLAGMPKEVIDKSKEIQFRLEQEDQISEKIIIETRKKTEKDSITEDVEEVDRLIKSKQLRLDEI